MKQKNLNKLTGSWISKFSNSQKSLRDDYKSVLSMNTNGSILSKNKSLKSVQSYQGNSRNLSKNSKIDSIKKRQENFKKLQ